MDRLALIVLLAFLTSCAETPLPAPDACAWVKPIETKQAVVRGSSTFNTATPGDLYAAERDILTPATAGQIVAHNKKVAAFCVTEK